MCLCDAGCISAGNLCLVLRAIETLLETISNLSEYRLKINIVNFTCELEDRPLNSTYTQLQIKCSV